MILSTKPSTLTAASYRHGLSELGSRAPDLKAVISKWGRPPFWTHEPGFPGLVIAILAQQVSLESAQAAFDKLKEAIGSIDPQAFLSLDDPMLRAIGFSRQKAAYVRGTAQRIIAGDLNLEAFASAGDDTVRQSLIAVRGIGVWTADTYLLFALRRRDAWPSGDLALAKAIQEVKGLTTTPTTEQVDRIADDWRPWRAVAARILWHHYLSERGRAASI